MSVYIICFGFLKYVLKFKTNLWPNGGLSSPDTRFPSSLPLFFLSWSMRKIQEMKGQSMHDLFIYLFFILVKETVTALV